VDKEDLIFAWWEKQPAREPELSSLVPWLVY